MPSLVATEIGIMKALHTGDPVRDLALCAAVPLALDRLREAPDTIASLIDTAKERMGDLLAGGRTYTTHTVELLEYGHDSGTHIKELDEHDHRALLFKAVSMYVADRVSLAGQCGRYSLFATAETNSLEASLLADPRLAQRQHSRITHAVASNRELTQLDVLPLPPIGLWIPMDKHLELQYTEVNMETKKGRVRVVRKMFVFRSRAADAPLKIRTFVDQAFANYLEIEKRKLESDEKRYLYVRNTSVPASEKSKDDGDDETSTAKKSAPPYKRYALGEEKTFDTVFFNEKAQVLKLLSDFTQRNGKFAIEGFPNKLGLLLHGPPGTGKTSLIKAIAQHTKRHIVSISLAKIQTNQELLDVMTDLRFSVRGVSLPVKLTFADVVFVMEDVDCATSVVKNRTDEEDDALKEPGALVRQENGEANQPLVLLAALLGDEELLLERGLVASSNRKDKLNLSGLLNVLDGVIDCPGRIVVMTTNHPEKLDPALIRPGRVNKKIHLAWMPPQQIQNMLEYYFDMSLSAQQSRRVLGLPEAITPAEVEEICAECDDVEDAVGALETKVAKLNSER